MQILETSDRESTGTIVPQPLWLTMLVSVLLLIFVGGMLFFRPDIAKVYWAWQLTPFNTRFLGGIYLSAIIPLLFCLLARRSAPLRIVLPMFAFFTTYLLLVSFAYTNSFNVGRTAPKIWFLLYGMDSFVGIYYLWRLRKQLFWHDGLARWFQLYRFQAIALGVYGIGLLILPLIFNSLWAWKLDLFHSRLYSGLFLAAALGLWLLSYSPTPQEHLMLNITQTALGGLSAIGMWLVDTEVRKLNWNSPNPWIWAVLFSLFGLIGLALSFINGRKLLASYITTPNT